MDYIREKEKVALVMAQYPWDDFILSMGQALVCVGVVLIYAREYHKMIDGITCSVIYNRVEFT